MKKILISTVIFLLISSCAVFKPAKKEEAVPEKVQPKEEVAKPETGEAERYVQQGIDYYARGEDSLALTAWYKAQQLIPKDAELHNFIGMALHKQGKIKEALNEFSLALENNPSYYEAYNNAGYMWLLLSNYDRAEAAFKQSLKYNPRYVPAIKNRQLLQKLLQGALNKKAFDLTEQAAQKYDYTEQIKLLQKVLHSDSSYAKAHNNIAVAYYYEDNIDSAYYHLRKALELNNQYPEAINNLGYLYKVARNYDAAIKLFMKALSLKPRYISALNNLGETYFLSGDKKNARRVFDTVLEIDPQNIVAKDWLAKL